MQNLEASLEAKHKDHEDINAKYKTLYDYDVPVREEEKVSLNFPMHSRTHLPVSL